MRRWWLRGTMSRCSKKTNARAALSVMPARRRWSRRSSDEASFERYVGDLVAQSPPKAVEFRFRYDVSKKPDALTPFDRIVIATGARYRFGLGPIAIKMLDWGIARWPLVSRVLSSPRIRDWF